MNIIKNTKVLLFYMAVTKSQRLQCERSLTICRTPTLLPFHFLRSLPIHQTPTVTKR